MGDRMTEMGPPTRLVGDNVEHWMTFALFAQGYPMAQGAFCSEHLGLAIIDDASHPGGTDAWTIRLSKTPCRTCSQAASGRRPCHPDASYSGIDQTPVTAPDKVWRCDSCGEVGTSAALEASHNGRRPSDGE
jgi:hypothetical protein